MRLPLGTPSFLALTAALASACAVDDAPASRPAPVTLAAAQSLPLRGVNLSGGDFGQQHLPGTFGTDYTYPTEAEVSADRRRA